jgi:hypothetical protein
MRRTETGIALVGVLALAGCVVPPPAGPSVVSMPGNGKNFPQFQQDDATCRQYAQAQIGPVSPPQAATDSAVGSAVLGTGIGAAAGAIIGAAAGNPGAGAAIGAGSGLLMGSAIGASNAQASGSALQYRYDINYEQCMIGNGEKIQPVQTASVAPSYGYYPYGYYPGGYYPAYPYYYGPPVYGSIFIGGGWGGHHHHW